MTYTADVPKHERPVVTALLTACLAGGENTISVYDGEEWSVKRTKSISKITDQLGAAEEDQLVIRNANKEQIGWFWLIYNNGSEGDPVIVIADYTANDFCDEIHNVLMSRYDA